jgi:FecR protein
MKNHLGSLGRVLLTGSLLLGMSAGVGAQQGPPSSQQPMEIPAQYQPQMQGGPPQGGPPQHGGPQRAQQGDPGAARISFVRGDVSTQHDGSNDWAAATVNTPVVSGDHISTGQNARAEIQLDHANVLRLSDQSTANVTSLSRTQMQLQIGQGLANYEVYKNNDANVEIQTPNVAIHPAMGEGSYRITVNSDNETIVDVRKGSAEISTPQGSTHVERDQRITIQGNADSAQYQVSGAPGRDDWDKWNGDRDHGIEGAESWQHTNPNYTGTQDLDGNGQWSNVPDYGSVWFPSEASGWAPYRDGRWVYEPYYGWTWVSYEPWGWAPYHYGRWFVYGGNWGWWPGPVYAGYEPLWAPAYVSFFGFGGGGWGVNLGFGFGGGFGSVGWLPCGPGDRFFPWYGRGGNRENVVNINNIHNNYGGISPLRGGTNAYSNVDRALTDEHVRNGISSMRSNDFGHNRVPMQQSRIDAGALRQASVITGSHPVSPSHESFQSTSRQVNPGSIPNRAGSNQHFFSSTARQNTPIQSGRGASNFNPGANANGNVSRGPGSSQASNQGQRGFTSSSSQGGQSIQSSRPNWHTFTPPSGQQMQSNSSGRGYGGQATQQPRTNYSQPSAPPRQYSENSRGSYYGGGSSRPTLSMQQPVVTPRGGGSYSERPTPSAPSGSYGSYGSAPSRGGSYSGRPMPSSPSGSYGSYGNAPSRGGSYSGRSMPSSPSGNYGTYRGAPSRGGSYSGSGRSMPSAPSGGNYGGGSRGGSTGGGSRGGSNSGGGGSRGGSSSSGGHSSSSHNGH